MGIVQIVTLAIIQGLTEFLPISSSAHLVLVPYFAKWQDQGLEFDVALHIGSLVAVLIYFRKDLSSISKAWLDSVFKQQHSQVSRLAWGILWGTIPAGLAGLAFADVVEHSLRIPLVIAYTTLFYAALLGVADTVGKRERGEYTLSWKEMVLIGCGQALALIPGTSRSGITMTVGLFLGLTRTAAARFSFLLSVPIITLAGAHDALKLIKEPTPVDWSAMLLGMGVSAITAYLCIAFLLKWLSRAGMMPFVIYRLALGFFLLFMW
jgi:undecaprenyl-diphosphatase